MPRCEDCNKRNRVVQYKMKKHTKSLCFNCFVTDERYAESKKVKQYIEEQESVELPILVIEGSSH